MGDKALAPALCPRVSCFIPHTYLLGMMYVIHVDFLVVLSQYVQKMGKSNQIAGLQFACGFKTTSVKACTKFM